MDVIVLTCLFVLAVLPKHITGITDNGVRLEGEMVDVDCLKTNTYIENNCYESDQSNLTICSNYDYPSQPSESLLWTCVLEDGRDDNKSDSIQSRLFLTDCQKLNAFPECFQFNGIGDILRVVCAEEEFNVNCKVIRNKAQNTTAYIRHFRQVVDAKRQGVDDRKESTLMTSPLTIVAYVSAVFILVSFILAVFIPEEKCRMKYQYDRDNPLRVPLEVYEMYGVNYLPSSRRQIIQEITSGHVISPPANRKTAAVMPEEQEPNEPIEEDSAEESSEYTIPTEEQTKPVEEQSIPTGEQSIPTEEQTIPTEEQTIPVEEQTIHTEEQTIPIDEQSIYIEELDTPTECHVTFEDI